MSMKHYPVIAFVLLLAVARLAPAGTMSLADDTGDPSQIDIIAGLSGTFTVNVNLGVTPPQNIAGCSFRLFSRDSDSAFAIVNRVITSDILTDPITANSTLLNPSFNALNPINDRNIGVTSDAVTAVTADETIMTLTISFAALSAGTYRINVTGNNDTGLLAVEGSDLEFNSFALSPGADYRVVVTAPDDGSGGGTSGGTDEGEGTGGGTSGGTGGTGGSTGGGSGTGGGTGGSTGGETPGDTSTNPGGTDSTDPTGDNGGSGTDGSTSDSGSSETGQPDDGSVVVDNNEGQSGGNAVGDSGNSTGSHDPAGDDGSPGATNTTTDESSGSSDDPAEQSPQIWPPQCAPGMGTATMMCMLTLWVAGRRRGR